MEALKNKILSEATVIGSEILKVDSFLNHQIDIKLLNEIGQEFKKRFAKNEITKILTVEASGIGIACIVAQYFNNIPVVFAKKHDSTTMDNNAYEAEVFSFTKNKKYKVRTSKKYINKEDKILIIDDFLANGNAALGLIKITRQAEASIVGVGIVIEKAFQNGRECIENEGIKVESLAIIKSLKDNKVVFKK
ncbi:xanthine phosphoribosyltransferase [Clostridium estertheticum]|uniref:xanthine phosphoribosyltransferase n=1 Tax=Clostridium estertheticum TaxID=238834 RepID=UPI001C6EA537|nr:xanthine phosphoribosyltransferase [Clostridium estertheticum]MBW9172875.1 xanthine phosphoribosyltransferase [Clostridium estertheticum]WLC75284.1 xanthine phosphoribosyltransferase [Clostridium estertheticum]